MALKDIKRYLKVFRQVKLPLQRLGRDKHSPSIALPGAEFHLMYEGVAVAILKSDQEGWTFRYSNEFRGQRILRPIVGFPDLDRVYRAKELWPFFQMRIPSSKQSAIRDIVEKESIDNNDYVQLLRRFGKRSIASLYSCQPLQPD